MSLGGPLDSWGVPCLQVTSHHLHLTALFGTYCAAGHCLAEQGTKFVSLKCTSSVFAQQCKVPDKQMHFSWCCIMIGSNVGNGVDVEDLHR